MILNRVSVSIVVPTYAERENLPLLCDGIRRALGSHYEYELIIVDDNSPDGTAEVAAGLSREDPRIRLIQRPGKLGLGSAVVDGFRGARGGYWVIMDADLSHSPDDLVKLLGCLSEAHIAIGSRYIKGGRTLDWPFHRRLQSQMACWLGSLITGLKVRDLTSGFAAFRAELVQPLLGELKPRGFKLVAEILARSYGVRVIEVPIIFTERRYGRSKFSIKEVLAFLQLCLELRSLVKMRKRALEKGSSC